MSLRSIPLLAISLILYNLVAFMFGIEALGNLALPEINMLSGGVWRFTWGDGLILVTLVLLFVELVKATYTTSSTLVDHGLSMIVFIVCLVEFLLTPQAATSVFFLIMVATAIDVIAGFTIGIRVARRDLAIGADH
jgi:hypothetical protein